MWIFISKNDFSYYTKISYTFSLNHRIRFRGFIIYLRIFHTIEYNFKIVSKIKDIIFHLLIELYNLLNLLFASL